jgi:hypothetical protein
MILLYLILSYRILSYLIASCLILSYLILSYLIVSYLILFFPSLPSPHLFPPLIPSPTFLCISPVDRDRNREGSHVPPGRHSSTYNTNSMYRRDSGQSKQGKAKEGASSLNGSDYTQQHTQGDRERKTDSGRLSVTLPSMSMAVDGKYAIHYHLCTCVLY